jgi:nicotinamidase-related amidase
VNTPAYDKNVTALLVVDPYNDFISEGGKIWPRIKAVAEANNCVPHMLEVLHAARKAKLRVFYAMHHRFRVTMKREGTSHPFKGQRGETKGF